MSELEASLRAEGMFDQIHAYAVSQGKTVVEALRSLIEKLPMQEEAYSQEQELFTVNSPDWPEWYAKTAAALGHEPEDHTQVILYKMFGKLWWSELSASEAYEIGEMYK